MSAVSEFWILILFFAFLRFRIEVLVGYFPGLLRRHSCLPKLQIDQSFLRRPFLEVFLELARVLQFLQLACVVPVRRPSNRRLLL
jgi:hypothetical protein